MILCVVNVYFTEDKIRGIKNRNPTVTCLVWSVDDMVKNKKNIYKLFLFYQTYLFTVRDKQVIYVFYFSYVMAVDMFVKCVKIMRLYFPLTQLLQVVKCVTQFFTKIVGIKGISNVQNVCDYLNVKNKEIVK